MDNMDNNNRYVMRKDIENMTRKLQNIDEPSNYRECYTLKSLRSQTEELLRMYECARRISGTSSDRNIISGLIFETESMIRILENVIFQKRCSEYYQRLEINVPVCNNYCRILQRADNHLTRIISDTISVINMQEDNEHSRQLMTVVAIGYRQKTQLEYLRRACNNFR